jgi:hypothetical protein
MARAPARAAGDAGSSPAPVANSTPEVPPFAPEPVSAPATASAPPWVSCSKRDIDHERHSREGLMAHVAGVIDEQLQNHERRRRNAAPAMSSQPMVA